MALIYSLHSEILKLLYRRATHVVLFLILVFQNVFSKYWCFSNLFQLVSMLHQRQIQMLVEAIPPIEFLGFDVTLIGTFFYDYLRLNLRS